MKHWFLITGIFGFVTVAETLHAGDWPQILGPRRNGEASGEKLPDAWPAGGPPVVWRKELGEGYAGPAVSQNRVYLFHRDGNHEVLEAFAAADGQRLWSRSFEATYRGGVNTDKGPRCVPTVSGDRVVVFGAAGDLHCVAAANGDAIWSRELYADFKGDLGYFGAGSSPLVVDDLVVVNVGGKDAGVVAVALKDGRTVWKSTKEGASYSSPIVILDGGTKKIVCVTRLSAILLAAKDGRQLGSLEFGRRGPTVNAATPLAINEQLFLTASYGIGAKLIRWEKDQPKVVWENDSSMSSQYSTSVHRGGNLYGIHGREDMDADLRCIEASTGKVRWSEADFGVAHLILAGERLLILKPNGTLILAEATPEKYRALSQSRIAPVITRALPALADGRLFVRTNVNATGELLAIDVR